MFFGLWEDSGGRGQLDGGSERAGEARLGRTQGVGADMGENSGDSSTAEGS